MLLYMHRFLCVLSCIWLFVTSWTVTHQAPLSMGFSRQEYWSGSYSTSYSRGFSQAMDQTPVSCVCCLGWRILYYCTTWEALTYITHPTINRGRSLHGLSRWGDYSWIFFSIFFLFSKVSTMILHRFQLRVILPSAVELLIDGPVPRVTSFWAKF